MNHEKTLEVTDADQVSPEKGSTILQIDNIQVVGLDPNDAEFYTAFPIERRKRLIRKVRIFYSSQESPRLLTIMGTGIG